MTVSRVFIKNVISSVAVRLLVPLGSFAVFVMIARLMGVEIIGKYTLIVTLFGVFQFLASLGLTPLIIREITQKRETPARIYSAAFTICLTSCLLWAPCLVIFAWLSSYPADVLYASLFVAAGLPFAFVSIMNEAVLMGMERFEFIPVINLAETVFIIAASLAVIWGGMGIVALSAVLVCGRGISASAGIWLLLIKTRLVQLDFDRNLVIRLIRMLPPFFANYAFGIIFYRIDVLMLALLVPERELGLYSTAYKLFVIALILPESFACAMYPQLSKAANDGHIHAATIMSVRYCLLCLTPIVLTFYIFNETLITLIFGEQFRQATATLDILIWLLPLQVINSILSNVFVSCNLERLTAALTIAVTALAAILCIPLIPRLGYKGAAVSLLITQMICFMTLTAMLRRKPFNISIIKDFTVCSLPALLGSITASLPVAGNSVTRFLIAMITAMISACFLKLITKDELLSITRKIFPGFSAPAEQSLERKP